jgi:hypothetical protein
MTLRRQIILVASLFIVTFAIGQLARGILENPGKVPILIEQGTSAEFEVRPWQGHPYTASLRVEKADLQKLPDPKSLSAGAASNSPISIQVIVGDTQGEARFERTYEVGSDSSSFSADARWWELGPVDLTSGRQTVRVTVLRTEPHLNRLPATFELGSYAKGCFPGVNCAAGFWLLLAEWPLYLILVVWTLGLAVIFVVRRTRHPTRPS